MPEVRKKPENVTPGSIREDQLVSKNKLIRDLIIPIDHYPHLNENQSLQEAIDVLMSFGSGEKSNSLKFRTILAINDQGQLVGKLSMLDIIHGLAPLLMEMSKVNKFEGKGTEYHRLTYLYEDNTFAECGKNRRKSIKPLLQPITFSLKADSHILEAIVMMSHHHDCIVPVTEQGSILGVLRLEEVFNAMCTVYCPI